MKELKYYRLVIIKINIILCKNNYQVKCPITYYLICGKVISLVWITSILNEYDKST